MFLHKQKAFQSPVLIKIKDEFQPVTSILEFQMFNVASSYSHGMTKIVASLYNLRQVQWPLLELTNIGGTLRAARTIGYES